MNKHQVITSDQEKIKTEKIDRNCNLVRAQLKGKQTSISQTMIMVIVKYLNEVLSIIISQ